MKVVIHIQGGVAHVETKDAGVELSIVDFDVEGIEEKLLTDYNGEKVIFNYFDEEEVIPCIQPETL